MIDEFIKKRKEPLEMSYLEALKEENEQIKERYQLAFERIQSIQIEQKEKRTQKAMSDYFATVTEFIIQIDKTSQLVSTNHVKDMSLEELEQLNQENYCFIEGSEKRKITYETSYLNPAYAVKQLGENYGSILSFLFTEIQGMIVYAYEQRYFDITILMELFIEVYNELEEETEQTYEKIRECIYYHFRDYLDITMVKSVRELLDPNSSFATEIIMESDFNDLRYLYQFGEYITENEKKTAEYLNGLSQEAIDSMARTYTEGFRLGFVNARIDLSKKSVVSIRYCIGFERMVKAAILQFEQMGLKPTICRASVSRIQKRQHMKLGYHSPSYNKQYEYDHRYDDSFYLDKAFTERILTCYRMALEQYKELASGYAGPACIDIFGEIPFEPVSKEECKKLSEKQQKLTLFMQREKSLISNEYIKNEETSFTIIAYPIPSIGKDFSAIFDATVHVNTLDMNLYKKIQQNIIDVLDQGEYVRIKGAGKNQTNLKVMLPKLKNPLKETNFENCLADVNIPVGEVFTSPQLTGTEGTLHVSEVYLRDLKYYNLMLHFTDGKIDQYNCTNFKEEEKNKAFVKENLMYQHETLPIGEFAIGTNTTAYKMGRDFQIQEKLPILIAEKTGPHFAVGDTCYRMSEDNRVYNPDGKEIVAKDNEISILRKTEIEKAYYNCHTDITIPYDELGEITVCCSDGKQICIIKDGKFVLSGTEELNKALS